MLKLAYSTRKATLISIALVITFRISAQPDVAYQPVIGPTEGLQAPIELVSAPGDASNRLFIVEKAGRIKIWNGSQLLSTPFLDISDRVIDDGERGLLSMAFHPQYQSNGYFFVYYNNNDGDITISRFHASPASNVADPDPTPAEPIFRVSKDASNHNGGHLQFRPGAATPYLYFATGDGGGGNDPGNNAQNLSSYLGKMIRINVDAPPYNPEIWAVGLRNPFRWSFDRQTGDIWIGDVGEATKEEINFRPGGTVGANYGWVCVEGTVNNSNAPGEADCSQASETIKPVFEYSNPDDGRSVIGGYVYRGNEYADLRGYYLTTDFFSGTLWLIRPDGSGSWEVVEKPGFTPRIASISETANGALYAVDMTQNRVLKIVTPIVTPLTLISFSGNAANGYNELRWTTENESSMDRYIIEYSLDGTAYETAGEVVSQNSNIRNLYSFRHAYTNRNTIYYRLKMAGLAGETSYSPVISFGAAENTELKIYPTSVTDRRLNIVSKSPVERIVITNAMGVQVLAREFNGATGFFTFELPALQKGMYIVRVSGKQVQKTEKIMVQ